MDVRGSPWALVPWGGAAKCQKSTRPSQCLRHIVSYTSQSHSLRLLLKGRAGRLFNRPGTSHLQHTCGAVSQNRDSARCLLWWLPSRAFDSSIDVRSSTGSESSASHSQTLTYTRTCRLNVALGPEDPCKRWPPFGRASGAPGAAQTPKMTDLRPLMNDKMLQPSKVQPRNRG
jgi:hypothetical protein